VGRSQEPLKSAQAPWCQFRRGPAGLLDPLHLSVQDRIEDGELRWQTVGAVQGFVILVVAHTFTEDQADGGSVEIIRIISARRATPREKRRYENQEG